MFVRKPREFRLLLSAVWDNFRDMSPKIMRVTKPNPVLTQAPTVASEKLNINTITHINSTNKFITEKKRIVPKQHFQTPVWKTSLLSGIAPTTGSTGSALINSKKFISPFKSFVTNGLRYRSHYKDSKDFDYHLSKDELNFLGVHKSPMKEVPPTEREILQNGKREAYLALRYAHSPYRKYNYPEATSWRIGWFHEPQ